VPLFRYRFAAGALDRMTANQVPWQLVLFVLEYGHPALRERLGSALLRLIAADPRGDLLMVTLLEVAADDDDTYEILSARYLDAEESAAASTLLTPREDR
jgi:hypothetical protein